MTIKVVTSALEAEIGNEEDPDSYMNLKNPDARRRTVALLELFRLDSFNKFRNIKSLITCFQDEMIHNRILAMRALWLCSMSTGGKVDSYTSLGMRMQIFDELAKMMIDEEPEVRITSCILTAALHVPLDLLLSTLSKKKRADSLNVNGRSDRIQDPGDIEITEVEMHEMSAAAYGSFIHASEDEFLRVRVAVIDSMFQLGLQEKKYAELCIKFLIDMFNDEEALVRRVSLQYVATLNKTWKFLILDENVDLYILALRDDDPFVKEFSHKMHSALTFKSKQGFEKIVNVLISELNESEDTQPMEALSALSKNNAGFVGDAIPSMFDLKNGFLPKEFSLNDISHRAHLVMIFNAASIIPDIIKILPKYVMDRYDFIHSYYEALVPNIQNSIEGPLDDECENGDLVFSILQESSKLLQLSPSPKPLQSYITMLEKSSSASLSILLCRRLLEYHCAFLSLKSISAYSDLYSAKKLVIESITKSLDMVNNEVYGLPVETFRNFQKCMRNNLNIVSNHSGDIGILLELKSGLNAEILLGIPLLLRTKERSAHSLKKTAFFKKTQKV